MYFQIYHYSFRICEMNKMLPEQLCQTSGTVNTTLELSLPPPPLQMRNHEGKTTWQFDYSIELIPTNFHHKPQLLNSELECEIMMKGITYDSAIYDDTALNLNATLTENQTASVGFLDWTIGDLFKRVTTILDDQYKNKCSMYPMFNINNRKVVLYLPPRTAVYLSSPFIWRAFGFAVNTTTIGDETFVVPQIEDDTIPESLRFNFVGIKNSTDRYIKVNAPHYLNDTQLVYKKFTSDAFLQMYEGRRDLLMDHIAFVKTEFNIPIDHYTEKINFPLDIIPSVIGLKLFIDKWSASVVDLMRQVFNIDLFQLQSRIWEETGNVSIFKTSEISSRNKLQKKDMGINLEIAVNHTCQFLLGWESNSLLFSHVDEEFYASQFSFIKLVENIVPFPWYIILLNGEAESYIHNQKHHILGVIPSYNDRIIPLKNHTISKNTLNKAFIQILDASLNLITTDYQIDLLFKIGYCIKNQMYSE